jgi:hypothetical protein
MKGVIVLMPVVQALVFGYAVTTDVRDVRTAVYDLDHSRASRELIAASSAPATSTWPSVSTDAEGARVNWTGQRRRRAALNHGFGAAARRANGPTLQVIVDGTDSNTAGIVLSYAAHRRDFPSRCWPSACTDGRRQANGAVGRRTGDARLVQRKPREPQLLRPRRDRPHRHARHADADVSMAVVREKGDRHHRADHGHAHHPAGVHPRQDGAVRAHRPIGRVLIALVGVFWFDVPIRGNLSGCSSGRGRCI